VWNKLCENITHLTTDWWSNPELHDYMVKRGILLKIVIDEKAEILKKLLCVCVAKSAFSLDVKNI